MQCDINPCSYFFDLLKNSLFAFSYLGNPTLPTPTVDFLSHKAIFIIDKQIKLQQKIKYAL